MIPRYLVALVMTISVYGIYGKFVAPRIEGKPQIFRGGPAIPIEHRPAADIKSELAGLFHKDGWEWQPCTILETSQAKILFHDHTILDDGSVELTPLSMVLNQPPQVVDGQTVKTPPIVLRAPQGARLKFENGLSAGGDLGNLEYGQLIGEVQLFRPATSPDANDSLSMNTQNVQISPERIFTLHECEFWFGKSYGRGKHLTVNMHGPAADSGEPVSTFSGVQQIELAQVDELYLHRESRSTDQTSLAVPNDKSANADLLGDTRRSFLISCRGPMLIDLDANIASFEDQVFVRTVGDHSDQVVCDKLKVFFEKSGQADSLTTGEDAASGKKSSGDFQIRQLLASGQPGHPAVITSISRRAQISAAEIDYNLVENRVILTGSEQAALLTRDGQSIESPEIRYSFADDGRLGTAVMRGPGIIRQPSQKNDGEEFVCRWQNSLTIQDEESGGKKVLTLDGARIAMNDTTVAANRMHIWMWELPETTTDGNQRWQFVPAKMLAEGQVRIESPRLKGDCRDAAAFWPDPVNRRAGFRPASPSNRTGRQYVVARRPQEYQTQRELSWQSNEVVPARQALSWQSNPAADGQTVQPVVYTEPGLPVQKQTRFVGISVQMQMQGGEDLGAVDEMTVDGDVVIQQQELSANGIDETVLEIRGQKLRAVTRNVTRDGDLYELTVFGSENQLAVVSAKQLLLQGRSIHLDQIANRLWINGPGQMHLEGLGDVGNIDASQVASRPESGSAGTTTVDWLGGMVFDGQTIYFETGVQSHSQQIARDKLSTSTTTTRSAALSITLNQRFDFSQRIEFEDDGSGTRKGDIEARTLVMVGWMEPGDVAFDETWVPAQDRRVRVATVKYNTAGKIVANQEVFSPRATFDVQSGVADCTGPGTVIARQPAGSGGLGKATPATLASTGQRKGNIDFIKVDYEKRFHIATGSKELRFEGNVHTFYSDASRWDMVPDERMIRQPGNRGMTMDCDNLVLAQWTPQSSEPTVEMIATGDAQVRGNQFDASAERISYRQNSGLIVLDAPARSNAELWFTPNGQNSRSHLVARTITYNIESGDIQVDQIRQMESQQGPTRGGRR